MVRDRKLTALGVSAFALAVVTFLIAGWLTVLYPTGATRPAWVEAVKGLLTGVCIVPWCLMFFVFPSLLKKLSLSRMGYIVRGATSLLFGLILLLVASYLILGSSWFLLRILFQQ
jgi:hypothetical protein